MLKANSFDAGYDLVATHDEAVTNQEVTPIHTGVFADIPQGHVGIVHGRSGLAKNHGVFVLGGVIDASYRGEIIVLLSKVGDDPYVIYPGDRIAQMVVTPLSNYTPSTVSERGDKGFGSSGK